MNVSVILGHPYDGSFNAAIAQTVVQTLEEDGHAVAFHPRPSWSAMCRPTI